MPDIKQNLLADREWVATFYPPDRKDLAFAGTLTYSPTSGLHLRYAIPVDWVPAEPARFLHGLTSDGERCTLVGEFAPARYGGFSYKNGMHCYRGRKSFRYFVLGLHCDDQSTFDSFDFTLSGTENFFGHPDFRRRSELPDEPLYSAKIGAGKLELRWSGSLDFGSDDLTSLFHDPDTESMAKLQSAYAEIRESKPNFRPYYKKQVDYSFRLRPTEDLLIKPAHQICQGLANLFSLLLFTPVLFKELYVIARDESDRPYQMAVFPASIAEKDTLQRASQAVDQLLIPLTIDDIDFEKALQAWEVVQDDYPTLISRVQSQGMVVASHAVLAGIVLSATQLEDIGHQANRKGDKYQFPIERYASDSLKGHLASLLSCEPECIGERISELRNEIAHVGRPKKNLANLNARQRHQIELALEVVAITYVLEKIHVTPAAREKYQRAVLRA